MEGGRWDVKVMDLNLDLDLNLALDLALGDWTWGIETLDLNLQEQREMRWVLPATPRFLFPRKAGRRGYLG